MSDKNNRLNDVAETLEIIVKLRKRLEKAIEEDHKESQRDIVTELFSQQSHLVDLLLGVETNNNQNLH